EADHRAGAEPHRPFTDVSRRPGVVRDAFTRERTRGPLADSRRAAASARVAGTRAERLGAPPARMSGGGRPLERRRSTRPLKKDPKSDLTPSGEPKMVARFRDSFVSWASVCGGLAVLDL